MAITLSGLASGIDTDTLVQKLVAAEKTKVTRVQTQQTLLQRKQTLINTASDKLKALQTTVESMKTQGNLAKPTATSSATDVATVSADGTASLGNYDVRVAALAKAERTYSAEFSGKDATGLFGTGNLRVSTGGKDYDIAVTASDTLSSIASKINAAATEVQASVFNTGTGYRLQLSGTKTGAAHGIDFTEAGTSFGLSAPGAELVSASDAEVSIDGFVVSSASNTLSDVILGVSLNLKGVTAGAVYDSATNTISGGNALQVSVARDTATFKTNVTNFVTAYNDAMNAISAVNGTTPDPSMLTVAAKMRDALRSSVSGLSPSLNQLAELGIATNKDGTVRLDDATFNKQVSANFAGAISLFASVGGRDGVAEAFRATLDQINKSSTGLISTKQKSLDTQLRNIAGRIDAMNAHLDSYQARLKKQFTAMEQAIAALNQNTSAALSAKNTNA